MARRVSAELAPGMSAAAKAYMLALTDLPLKIVAVTIPAPVREHRFDRVRKWRFDFAYPAMRLAIEVQGGIFSRGRHTRGAALLKEYEKLNEAALAGWRVLFVTPQQVQNGEATKLIARAIANEGTR